VSVLKVLCRRVLAVSVDETTAARRGFHSGNPATVVHLNRIGAEFLAGYHAALEERSAADLAARLDATIDNEYRGFAFEGAGMALTLTDHLHLTGNGFADLLRLGGAHWYTLHVGAGWAWARLPWIRRRLVQALGRLDPMIGWLAVDGYGFHEGYFHTGRTVWERVTPRGVGGYARRAFDQGVGRSLWFVGGADPEVIARSIARFALGRQADLWSGVGLACGYAGGVSETSIRLLRRLALPHGGSLSLGCAFACEARRRAGSASGATELAARVLCNLSAEQAAAAARDETGAAVADGSVPAYEVWRRRTQARVAGWLESPEVTA